MRAHPQPPRRGTRTRTAVLLITLAVTIAGCSGAADVSGAAAASPSPTAPTVGPAEVVARYVDAYNADELDRMMTLFSEDARITDHPFSDEVNGTSAIRILHNQDRAAAAADSPYEISEVAVDGDTVTWNHVWTSSEGDEWCAEGHEAVVSDGRIVEWRFAPNPHPCP